MAQTAQPVREVGKGRKGNIYGSGVSGLMALWVEDARECRSSWGSKLVRAAFLGPECFEQGRWVEEWKHTCVVQESDDGEEEVREFLFIYQQLK